MLKLKPNSLLLLFIGIFLCTFSAFAQLSKTHYIPPLTASEFGNANPENQYLYISTPSNTDVNFTIETVGVSSKISGVVSSSNPYIYDEIGSGYGPLFVPSNSTSIVINNRGFIIEAEDVIYVSVRMEAGGAQAGALVSKGIAALGKEFRVGAYTNEAGRIYNSSNGTYSNNLLSFLSVMATENNTTVTFSNISNDTEIINNTKSFPYSEVLNKGETYIIAMNSYSASFPNNNKDGLIGALIESDEDIVVNVGSANGSFHNGGGRDYGIDQIVGEDKIGNEYIFVRGFGDDDWENILIVAHYDNTSIYVNDDTSPITTIDKGEYYVIEGDKFSGDGNMYVKTTENVFAYQGVGGLGDNGSPSEANQGMFFVPPLSCETRGNINNIANISEIGEENYDGGLSIVTKKGATVTINNSPLSSYSSFGPFDVLGNSNYVTYKVININEVTTSVECDDELYCAYFNYNGAATSGSFYSGFPTAPEINFDATFTTLGICIPNITLEVANMGSFDSVEWYYDDGSGSGFQPTGNTSLSITPTLPGNGPFNSGLYKLKGVLNCSMLTLWSEEVPVSICPDDIDNDGIIDNLDIDNDNDGILNCTESFGDEAIDLSNINGGSLTDSAISYTGLTTTTGSSATNPITGNADGAFLSEVPASSVTSQNSATYSLSFAQPLNILFKFPSGSSLGSNSLNADQEFIIQVNNTKAITLVDPDDQLLVDTNYDGVYESGVTQFSSFEIRFKINGTSLLPSDSTFEFVANLIDFFSFTHKNISETNSNTAVFKIKATCVPKDSDGDGLEDALDFDSDNDGIPDYIENLGANTPLSGTDADANGLDDIYNISDSPNDTDGDGLFDFYDLDSDNDGITDLYETGEIGLLSDTDMNGIVDGTIFGQNGWIDVAETVADSGIIGYTLNDLDSDTIFSYIDADSDGDECSDVIEAGFSDGNLDDFLGDLAPTVDSNGLVNNASDGYTTPNSNYNTAGIIDIVTQPTAQITCELDTTVFSIETSTIDSYQWEVSTDNGITWVTIIDDLIYSNASTNSLTIVNTPTNYANNLYRVQLATNGNSCGKISDAVLLTVNPLPIANTVLDLELCDDNFDGNDTNGIVQNFDLESQTATILGAQNPVDFTVTYHLNQTDADLGNAALLSPFENTIANSQPIYVRVENIATGCFNTTVSFNTVVNPLPIVNPVSNIELCDDLSDGDDTNGFVQSFDLESQTSTILGSQMSTDFTVTYHISQSDADTGANVLISPFENTITNIQTIYVRIENNITGCFNSAENFEIIVNALPISNPVSNLEVCDDASDGNDTNGIIQNFDLESQTSTILGSQPATDYIVTYHLSQSDADTGANALTSPHSNTASPNNQIIYTRVLNTVTGCFNTHLNFELIVHPLPIITNNVQLLQCDDDTDGFSPFNLTEVNAEISSNYMNETFSYYTSLADAQAENNAIANPTSYTNQIVTNDFVWARVSSSFGCSRISEIELIVSTTVIPDTFQRTFNVCDDYLDASNDDRDGISTFNFSSVDAEVRNYFPPGQQLIINYYRNEMDALQEVNAIADISNYRNIGYPNSQQIYIRVDSQINNDCLAFGPHITLNVEALPTANPVTINRQCDDDNDGMYPFDISMVESTVLNGQSNVTVSYFDENNNALPSPLPNPFLTSSQTITIRVTNNTTADPNGACYDETTLQFIVDVAPVANNVIIPEACDDESNDGYFDFDTSAIQATLLGGQTGMDVFYFDASGTQLPSPLPNPFNSPTQSITAVVSNPLNSVCEASTTINFTVNPLPDFSVISPEIICITEPPSTKTLTLDIDPSEIVTYEWTNSQGTVLSTSNELGVTTAGTYYIEVTKADGTNCSRTREIVVNPSIIPTITFEDIVVEDDSDNNTITIITDNLGIGDYEFAIDEPFAFQDEPYFDYVTPGIHPIFIQDKNGCGMTAIEVSVIGFPKFFTPNNDGYNDTWKVLGVTEQLYTNVLIYIFDRFGKLVGQVLPNEGGWNGMYNGEILPSTDYWFTAELTNLKGETKIRKGHFSLKR